MKLTFKLIQIVFFALVSLGIVRGLSHLRAFDSLEAATFDLRQIAFAPKTEASKDIVMVWLDEQTMKALPYRSPVPRNFLTDLNERLLKAGPKLIAYDIFLKDPSFPNEDIALAQSLQKGPTYAVMPMRLECPDKIPPSPQPSPSRGEGEGGGDQIKRMDGCVDQPLPIFKDALQGSGLADLPFNPFDSVVRYARFEFQTDLGKTPSFAALLFEKAAGVSAKTAIDDTTQWPHIGRFSLTPFAKPTGETFIRFAGPPSRIGNKTNTFTVFPAHLVVKGIVPSAWLQDKIVLVGAAYADLEDAYLTPYYGKFTDYARMNGVEIHANILSGLLTRQFYYTLERWQAWALTAALIILILLCAAFLSPPKSAVILLCVSIAGILCAGLCFKNWGVVFPVVMPACGMFTSFGIGIGWRALTEGRQRRWIKGVFSQYVPPAVVDQMIQNPKLVKLGGEERIVTSLFSDIASFTSISERLNPSALVKFLNEYLSLMNDILFQHGGTIDKYEGDAIIAFFNAPLEVANHEMAAARSAIAMQRACAEISKKWESRCGRPVVARIGLNTGTAVVGNMGSEDRFDYTAIGDAINLASRLEGTNKFYGTTLMASEMTANGLDDSIVRRPIDRVRVKGKREAILLYEIMCGRLEPEAVKLRLLAELFTLAFNKFEMRALDDADKLLHEILRQYPDDQPSKELLARCKNARENPSWDLVTELSAK